MPRPSRRRRSHWYGRSAGSQASLQRLRETASASSDDQASPARLQTSDPSRPCSNSDTTPDVPPPEPSEADQSPIGSPRQKASTLPRSHPLAARHKHPPSADSKKPPK